MTLPLKPIGRALLNLLTLGLSARKQSAEAAALDLANSKEALQILMEDIVNPLRQELAETRQKLSDVQAQLDVALEQLKVLSAAERRGSPD